MELGKAVAGLKFIYILFHMLRFADDLYKFIGQPHALASAYLSPQNNKI